MFRRTTFVLGCAVTAAFAGPALAAPMDEVGRSLVPSGQVSPREAVLYDNTPSGTETVFSTTTNPRTGGADEAIFSGIGALIDSFQFGYLIAAGGPAAFDARVRFWDDIDLVTTTGPQFLNLVGDVTVSFTGQTAGAFIPNPISLGTLPGGGVSVTSNAATVGANLTDVYVQLDFLQPGTNTPVANNAVTFIFDGSGVNTGFTFASAELGGNGTATDEVYWRDTNQNGIITADEARNFAAPNRANFVLRLEGTVVPEPGTLGLAGLGAVALGLRRRRA